MEGLIVFMTSDWQDKHICVYLVDFVQFLPTANFVGGAFKVFVVWNN